MSATLMAEPASVLDNGVPAVAQPAPGPTDDELRKEAAEVEEQEEEQEDEQEEEENAVSKRLFGAVQEVLDEIDECQKKIQTANETADKQKESVKVEQKAKLDQIESECNAKLEKIEEDRTALVEETEARAEELKAQTAEWFSKMQSTFGISAPAKHRRAAAKAVKAPRKARTGKSARLLILELMEKQGKATTKEIRSMLERHGKHSGGVELSRMVNDGSIVNKERGVYVKGK